MFQAIEIKKLTGLMPGELLTRFYVLGYIQLMKLEWLLLLVCPVFLCF